jgi:hypothetical protein
MALGFFSAERVGRGHETWAIHRGPKSGYRFSEKIMLRQQAKAKRRFTYPPFLVVF